MIVIFLSFNVLYDLKKTAFFSDIENTFFQADVLVYLNINFQIVLRIFKLKG